MPASNMKVLTTGAAMMVLGADFAFKTEVVLDGTRLIVRGSGDPAFADPDMLRITDSKLTANNLVDTLSAAVASAGARQVSEVIIDDRVFDRQFTHPSWNPDNFEETYSAEVSGLNFHANTLSVFPRPSPQGQGSIPLCDTEPNAPWLRVDCAKARTVTKGKNSFWIARASDTDCFLRNSATLRDPVYLDGFACNSFSLRGDVKTAAPSPAFVNIRNVPAFFGNILASDLTQHGVTLTGAVNHPDLPPGVRIAIPGEVLDKGRVVAVVTTPLTDIISHCNTESQNMYAECLLKRMGHQVTKEPGGWSNGGAVLRMMIGQELGPEAAAETTISDGSGLSRDNRVTPSVLAKWLRVCADKPWGTEFVNSLAAPGTGTLEKRFKSKKLTNEVRAKSGYINGVRSLSGYVTDPVSGDRLIFAVLINDLPNGSNTATTQARELHEDIVDLVDDALVRRTTARKLGG
jgi:D-alanyl-D-alanine carboxypeptidase/D-alanyl-D-alanine-endopeptidase (penicillin-binding protein 4)